MCFLSFLWICFLEKDFFGFDEKGERILFTQSEADVDETISVKKSVLKKWVHVPAHNKGSWHSFCRHKCFILENVCQSINKSFIGCKN